MTYIRTLHFRLKEIGPFIFNFALCIAEQLLGLACAIFVYLFQLPQISHKITMFTLTRFYCVQEV